jgi:hypothetical protein
VGATVFEELCREWVLHRSQAGEGVGARLVDLEQLDADLG